MGVFSTTSRYSLAFLVMMNLCLKAMASESDIDFSFKNFGKVEPHLALYGDAEVNNHSSSIQISGSTNFSAGRLIFRKPINLVGANPRTMVSFSTYFAFSISGENGDGLAFVVLPVEFPLNIFDGGSMGLLRDRKIKFLAVELDTYMDKTYNDVNNNHVGLDIETPVSVKVGNLSSVNLVLNNGEKLQCWIDYEASGKRIEVRVSKFGETKPVDPLLFYYPLDLSQMWGDEKNGVFVGFVSSNGNSSQKISIHSWSFKSRMPPPRWMHSEPLDPDNVVEIKGEEGIRSIPKRSDCTSRVVLALVFGAGCGVIVAFFIVFVWIVVGSKRPVAPEELAGKGNEFEYKKFGEERAIKDGDGNGEK
ncbi:L-type lectin-domain containing receptor kinase VIII.2-like [Andrographis paniculata]|uniref:L-type lectin-domain containing receptor kinase VIII.2-like n=1 Tax=Andrographis paniculata TaxID=175694 RepID=UPI0021E7CF15|nr:L-type lectin-domain containing receptor kinase VIII.2-like [Andrographis paniculata]